MNLKQQLLQTLNEGKKIKVAWNGGGDEVFFHLFIDGQEDENDFSCELDEYLAAHSPISGVGEITLEGEGEINIEDNKIVLTYTSTIYMVDDYDEESGEPILADEDAEIEEDKFILFVV